jgi:hypothetical protein
MTSRAWWWVAAASYPFVLGPVTVVVAVLVFNVFAFGGSQWVDVVIGLFIAAVFGGLFRALKYQGAPERLWAVPALWTVALLVGILALGVLAVPSAEFSEVALSASDGAAFSAAATVGSWLGMRLVTRARRVGRTAATVERGPW